MHGLQEVLHAVRCYAKMQVLFKGVVDRQRRSLPQASCSCCVSLIESGRQLLACTSVCTGCRRCARIVSSQTFLSVTTCVCASANSIAAMIA
jgi:hypothetical protein